MVAVIPALPRSLHTVAIEQTIVCKQYINHKIHVICLFYYERHTYIDSLAKW